MIIWLNLHCLPHFLRSSVKQVQNAGLNGERLGDLQVGLPIKGVVASDSTHNVLLGPGRNASSIQNFGKKWLILTILTQNL